MALLSFGQPARGIMQMAYVVADLEAAIGDWIKRLNVGPWFVLERFTGFDPVYRGARSRAEVAIAMSFAGHMNIELIQPRDSEPSVYREIIDSRGHGFHHWGVASADFAGDVGRFEAMGMNLAFRAGVPTGGEVAYFDTNGAMPGMIELIETGPLMERVFAGWFGAALTWDGSDPIRPFV